MLLSIEKKILFSAIKLWLDSRSTQKFFSLNADLQILISHMYLHGFRHNQRAELVGLARLLFRPRSKFEYLWRFHYEVTDVRGKYHISPLHRIKNMPQKYPDTKQEFQLTLAFLSYAFKSGELDLLTTNIIVSRDLMNKSLSIIEKIYSITSQLDIEQSTMQRVRLFDELGHRSRTLANCLKRIHENIFVDFNGVSGPSGWGPGFGLKILELIRENGSVFSSKVAEVEKSIGSKLDIRLHYLDGEVSKDYTSWKTDRDFESLFVLFDLNVAMVIGEIVGNFKHCSGIKISNSFAGGDVSGAKAHAWIQVKPILSEGIAEISFSNALVPSVVSSRKEHDILHGSLSKIENSGGKYRIDESSDIFVVILRLPFAHVLEGGTV